MRSLITLIVPLLAALLFSTPASAAFEWRNFGADPFASSRDDAMQDRERVFRESFGFSIACVAEALRVTSQPGATVRLNVGDQLTVMLSGGFVSNPDTVIAFAPVRTGIEYAATAESWTIFCDGVERQILLPEICFNWSLRTPPRGQEVCLTAEFTVVPGDLVRWALLTRRPMPRSGCWEVCDGDVCSSPQTPCDNCNWLGPLSRVPNDRVPLHSGTYTARATRQTISLPLAAGDEYLALCVDREGQGQSDGGVIEPSDWHEFTYALPPQVWPVWRAF